MNSENIKNNIGKVLDERYEILSQIGEGGMAIVYKALDKRLERNVAVKVMRDELSDDEEFKHRFCAESHAVAMLSHPNIVAVYDVSHNDEIEYIVMELINGITLRQYMDKKIKVSWKEVLHFSKQICKALSHAHQHGIIHRDIKPQNIMLLKDGTIKVADFGIAALENELDENKYQAIGSLNYLSPEQIRGRAADARGDLYSLGIMMYEMLVGAKPYSGDTPAEIAVKQNSGVEKVKDIISDIPDEFSDIVMKAMEPDAALRYQTASEMLNAMDFFTVEYLKAETAASEILEAEAKNVDLSRKEFFKNIKRAGKVSFGLGSFALLAAFVAVFVLLWNMWLKDIFSPALRIDLPDFVGMSYEELSEEQAVKSRYNFKINYIVDTSTKGGTVLKQNPIAGRSLMLTSKGIDVTLDVSTGYTLTDVPDVVGQDYREASLRLQNAGLNVEINNITSNTVDKNCVISSSPKAGEQISAGSTVYLDVSSGVQIEYIKMPNLIGLTEDAAINKLQQNNLNFEGSDRQESDFEAGTVIGQSKVAFSEVEEHTGIRLKVSSGPTVTVPPPSAETIIQPNTAVSQDNNTVIPLPEG